MDNDNARTFFVSPVKFGFMHIRGFARTATIYWEVSRRHQVRLWRRGGGGKWGEGVPSQPTKGFGRASLAPPVGFGAEPRPKLNFAQSECKRSHLVALIALNFLPDVTVTLKLCSCASHKNLLCIFYVKCNQKANWWSPHNVKLHEKITKKLACDSV